MQTLPPPSSSSARCLVCRPYPSLFHTGVPGTLSQRRPGHPPASSNNKPQDERSAAFDEGNHKHKIRATLPRHKQQVVGDEHTGIISANVLIAFNTCVGLGDHLSGRVQRMPPAICKTTPRQGWELSLQANITCFAVYVPGMSHPRMIVRGRLVL